MKKELSDLYEELKTLNSNFKELSGNISRMVNNLSGGIDKVAEQVQDLNKTINESMSSATKAVIDMTEAFGKVLNILTIGSDAKDNIIKGLGIDNLIPDFMKKKKKDI
ncbi:MAG: hypothetical protein JW891_12250 [Candidatus Lokiarchaeota archaeon]|nr:hypothetical protein [Candidatus Lokiarchaeota archaeon]